MATAKLGSQRIVILTKYFVVKMPRNFKGWLSNIQEVYFWHKNLEIKDWLCPVLWSDPFRIIVVMPFAEPISEEDCWGKYLSHMDFMAQRNQKFHAFNDIHSENIGMLNGVIVKFDYGNDFWLKNSIIDAKEKIKGLMGIR